MGEIKREKTIRGITTSMHQTSYPPREVRKEYQQQKIIRAKLYSIAVPLFIC